MLTGKLKKGDNQAYIKINNQIADENGNFTVDASTVGLESFEGFTPQTLPVSDETQTELDSKQNELISGIDIKTINNQSLLGEGNIVIDAGTTLEAGDNITIIGDVISAEVPTSTSELTNDSNFVVDAEYVHIDNNFTDAEKAKLASLENYDDTGILADIDALETDKVDKVDGKGLSSNDFTDGYINFINHTDAVVASLSTNKADKATTYTKTEVDAEINAKLTGVFSYKGSLADRAALDAVVNPEVGDTYNLLDTGVNYTWNGTEWDSLSGVVDLTGYALKTELPTSTSDLVNDSDFVVDANYVHTDSNFTEAEKTKLAGIEESANNFELGIASETVLGGVKAIAKTTEKAKVAVDAEGNLWSSSENVFDGTLGEWNLLTAEEKASYTIAYIV